MGDLSIAFAALFLATYASNWVRPRMGVRLDAESVHARLALRAYDFDLPWSERVRVRVVEMQRQPSVVFDAVDPDWGLSDAKPLVRAIRRLNRPFYALGRTSRPASWVSNPRV